MHGGLAADDDPEMKNGHPHQIRFGSVIDLAEVSDIAEAPVDVGDWSIVKAPSFSTGGHTYSAACIYHNDCDYDSESAV